jgi:phage tail-like protein
VSRGQLEQLLPGVFRRALPPGSALGALLDVVAGLVDPVELTLSDLDSYFDPWRCPDRFLPLLAAWLDLPLPITTGPGRLRALLHAAARLHQLRGTKNALVTFLEVATGVDGFRVDEEVRDESGKVKPFFALIQAPESTRPHSAMLRRIIESERPAHVRCELAFVPPVPASETRKEQP